MALILTILGVWNERGTNREYVIEMRKLLDENGMGKVKGMRQACLRFSILTLQSFILSC
jgi:hypothetical protein